MDCHGDDLMQYSSKSNEESERVHRDSGSRDLTPTPPQPHPSLMGEHESMAVAGVDETETLVKEFEEWFRCHQQEVPIYLLEANSNHDGCIVMTFSLAGEQDFALRCPPRCSNGDRCLAEAGPRLYSWVKAMNEFLLESPHVPGLSEALTKAVELYLQKDTCKSTSKGDLTFTTSCKGSSASLDPVTCGSFRPVSCEGSKETEAAKTCESSSTGVDSLMKEYEEWNRTMNDQMLFLLEVLSNPDGSTSLRFCLGGDNEFILHCPQSYSSLDDRFLVEAAPCVNSWSTLLNEFLLDSPEILRLPAALSKAVQLYRNELHNQKKHRSSEAEEEMEESDEGSSEEVEMTDDDIFTTEWELKVARKKKKWMQKELELRTQIKRAQQASCDVREKCSNLVDGLTGPSAQQIFSTSASSGVLTNDLIAIMEKGKELGIFAEPIDDNIYCWSVKMSRFDHNSPIIEDLRIVHQLFGYKHIELQLDFTMDLYPFYPPQLKVIRPRLQAAMMQRISNLELLKLSLWNPACNLISVLLEIKDFVQQFARLETHRERNCPKRFPEGAYLPLDHHLLRLAMVSEVPPRANNQFLLQTGKTGSKCENQLGISYFSSLPSFLTVGQKKDRREYWASGTGYGHDNRPGWDVGAYMAAQNLKDRQIEAVLGTIVEDLRNDSRCIAGQDCSALNQMMIQQPAKSDESVAELYEILEGSALIPFMEFHLKVDSLLEVGRHVVLYKAIVDVVREIVHQPPLIRLLGPLPRQSNSIHRLLGKLKAQATAVLDRLGKASAASESDAKSNLQEVNLAREFCNIYEEVKCTMEIQGVVEDGYGEDSRPSNCVVACTAAEANMEEVIYCKCLKPLQLKSFHFASSDKMPHAFGALQAKSNPPSPKQVMRIAQELSSLSNSLPLSLSSSIFVRMDDENCSLLRAIITGPEGTPYSGGCFQFDVYFPPRYPQEPPKVQLMTTGKRTVRFNPNLYACGKVCLSLLGTWEGQKGEKWNETSTLLQVLISIQSLILVPEPYFNEPGYEVSIGTEAGTKRSEAYNQDVLTNNIRWAMVDQLKKPTPGFEEVINSHFSLRKASLLKEMHEWSTKFYTRPLANAVKELEDLLKLLAAVQEPT